jgi:hypothetical protein
VLVIVVSTFELTKTQYLNLSCFIPPDATAYQLNTPSLKIRSLRLDMGFWTMRTSLDWLTRTLVHPMVAAVGDFWWENQR